MYSKKYISIFSICLMTFLTFNLSAQDKGIDKKNFSEDLLKIYNPWIATQNYSGLYFYSQEKISEFMVGYNNTTGDYARSMDASDIRKLSVGTYSYQKYKGIGLYGKFEYINSYEDNVKWCDVMNPYNGNPFILGDAIGGDYHKEIFKLSGGIASKLLGENSMWGVGVNYVSGTGGKDNDPRPLNKIMNAQINPGLLFNINNFRLGFNFNYSYNKEEIDMKSFIDNEKYDIYQFRGLGLFLVDNVSDFDRNYFSNMYGGNVQLGFKVGNIDNITEMGFSYKKEDIEDGSSTIKDFGCYEQEKLSFKSNFVCKSDNIIHNLVLSGEFLDRMGTINVVRKESDGFTYVWKKYGENRDYTQKLTKLGLDYSFFKMNSKYSQNWKAEICAEYFDSNKQFKFDPVVFEEDYQGIDLSASLTKFLAINKKSLLAVNINGGYKYNFDNMLNILNESNKDALLVDNIEDFIVNDVVVKDNEWATADVVKLGGFVKYSFDTNIGKNLNSTYLKLAADYFTVKNGMFDGEERLSLSATLGILF